MMLCGYDPCQCAVIVSVTAGVQQYIGIKMISIASVRRRTVIFPANSSKYICCYPQNDNSYDHSHDLFLLIVSGRPRGRFQASAGTVLPESDLN